MQFSYGVYHDIYEAVAAAEGIDLTNFLKMEKQLAMSCRGQGILKNHRQTEFARMGFSEIKKMFELYADNKLSIEPIPNYFDRILFGKIVSAYKQQRKVKPKEIKMPELSQEEKDNLTYMGVVNCFDRFTQTNDIMNGYTWVYDHLESIGVLKYSDKEKRSIMPIATERLKIITKELYGLEEYKTLIRDLEAKRNGGAVIVVAKKMLLERFFMKITSKNKHIKDYLK